MGRPTAIGGWTARLVGTFGGTLIIGIKVVRDLCVMRNCVVRV